MTTSNRILNFGSLNIDLVYRVPRIVRPGETLAGRERSVFAGGTGANQSMALARAGVGVCHAGKVGDDGRWLVENLAGSGVDTRHVLFGDEPTGHAVIQVADDGENAIVLFGGGNQAITVDEADRVLAGFGEGDLLLVQNEISELPHIIQGAAERGMFVAFNPAPFGSEVASYPLDRVDLFVVNKLEAAELEAIDLDAELVVTLGSEGALYRHGEDEIRVAAPRVEAVDTTGAGDTFVGYFLAGRMRGYAVRPCLEIACRAAAICVTRPGAADSIPCWDEVM